MSLQVWDAFQEAKPASSLQQPFAAAIAQQRADAAGGPLGPFECVGVADTVSNGPVSISSTASFEVGESSWSCFAKASPAAVDEVLARQDDVCLGSGNKASGSLHERPAAAERLWTLLPLSDRVQAALLDERASWTGLEPGTMGHQVSEPRLLEMERFGWRLPLFSIFSSSCSRLPNRTLETVPDAVVLRNVRGKMRALLAMTNWYTKESSSSHLKRVLTE
mmetsp:Transcript_28167/g.65423  ORF Transcript_28167/g.65423 Transcript_28167/m.65423 type:complete len:221 (+) Transcript_28167:46-708(+)